MRRAMERKSWDTAIRCLEIAVHPNTSDEELIAAVNGFRRTAAGAPLSRICREFAEGARTPANTRHLLERLDQVNQENRELRRKAAEADAGRTAALRRAAEAEQQARDIAGAALAAEHRADVAEQRLAEFQAAYGRISGGLHNENFDLRRALDEVRRISPEPEVREAARPFQHMLDAARRRPDQAPAAPPTATSGRPWTA
jgi:hypothetical protein